MLGIVSAVNRPILGSAVRKKIQFWKTETPEDDAGRSKKVWAGVKVVCGTAFKPALIKRASVFWDSLF